MRGKYLYYSLLAVFLLCPVRALSQTVTKVFSKTPLKTVLKEVEKQTRMSVIYKVNEVDANKKISASFKNEPVSKVLDKVLDPSLTYTIENKMITIYRRGAHPHGVATVTNSVGQPRKIQGTVVDSKGEPLIGVTVRVRNSKEGVVTDIDGNYSLTTKETAPTLEFSYIGYAPQTLVATGARLNVTLSEESSMLNEVVVTAMGIQRKEKSLTYATQQVKADDLMRVQDPNVVNSLEGKVSGVTITPSAGGAGGASKIILRGNKSILGNSSPLIVVDGVPMSNSTRGQIGSGNITYSAGSEGGDPLSMINPDDIESMNVLKGANAAALYGSAAANGVVMITTKSGKAGKLQVSVTSNVTLDTPLLTPQLQSVFGSCISAGGGLEGNGWGARITDRADDKLIHKHGYGSDSMYPDGAENEVHLRNKGKNSLNDFYQMGTTVNTSIALSGGTDKLKTYFSYSNSHSTGMLPNNSYNRNTFNFRQQYTFFNRLHIDASLNYMQTKTKNRPGGGGNMNPIYNMYTTPADVDMNYYRDNYMIANGSWRLKDVTWYTDDGNGNLIRHMEDRFTKDQPMMRWAMVGGNQNNPFWLLNMRSSVSNVDRVFGTVSGRLELLPGLDLQARFNYDHTKFNDESKRYASYWWPTGMDATGQYGRGMDRRTEMYSDVLLSYNKTFNDIWSVSATAGYVGHISRTHGFSIYNSATPKDGSMKTPITTVNFFDASSASSMTPGNAVNPPVSNSTSTNWDRAALFTAQFGWKDMVYFDASYRQDWYRAFLQFEDRGTPASYGYFGFGANAIVSQLFKLPEVVSYLKYRASYSEVGNSIPNTVLAKGTYNPLTGIVTPSPYSAFKNPRPEKTRSFETGIESSFFGSKLDFDFTFYNAVSADQYMVGTNAAGKSEPMNSGKILNRGIETTIAYNFNWAKDWKWRTSYNLSYNHNEILETTYNPDGSEKLVFTDVAGARVRYKKGGSIGDMYVSDYRRDAEGKIMVSKSKGRIAFETDPSKQYTVYAGNMNSKWQMGWSNTFSYKGFQLFFMINGRIGGKVISLTEAELDNLGMSQRTADARLAAEANDIWFNELKPNGDIKSKTPGMYLPDGSGRVVGVETYYKAIGGSKNPLEYIYDATNFRLRELSFGYTFRNLFQSQASLNVSFIARNLFFLYKKSPVDPDVSLSTGNGLSAFEYFNMPSSRSYGLSMKLTF
ncbi:SusC/RagA family TonB-linked outer membrane protein [Prevotella sp. SGI.027]